MSLRSGRGRSPRSGPRPRPLSEPHPAHGPASFCNGNPTEFIEYLLSSRPAQRKGERHGLTAAGTGADRSVVSREHEVVLVVVGPFAAGTVSYTHLTLPT